jgi:ribonuclease T2
MPGVVCSYKKCDELGELSSDSLNYHGIWPNRLDGKHPFFCTKDIYIEETMPASLLQTLDTVWTGLYNSTFWFRFHEYTKHGTCFKVPGEDSSFLNLNKLTYSDNHQ